jgi:hypothetical protein
MVAVGPQSILETVNTALGIYDKAGNLQSKQSLQNFFAQLYPTGYIANLVDPAVSYDEQAGRFAVGALDLGTDSFDLAVSNTSTPTGDPTGWDIQQISLKEKGRQGYFQPDFTRLGWNGDTYAATFNMYSPSGSYDHVQVVGVQKASMLNGNANAPVTFRADRSGTSNFTLVPATMYGDTTGGLLWIVQESGFNNFGKSLDVTKMTYTWTTTGVNNLHFSDSSISLPVSAHYIAPPLATQPPSVTGSGPNPIDAGDSRFLSVVWQGGRLLASQTVGEKADNLDHARWYEFNTTTSSPTLKQWGDVAPGITGANTYYLSVGIAPNGSLGMSFLESSPSEPMSMYVTGQAPGDALNTVQTPVLGKAGVGPYSETFALPYRAGDFSAVSVDPVTGAFWAVNEYANAAAANNWGTWITSFTVSPGTHTLSPGSGSAGSSSSGPVPARFRSSPRWSEESKAMLIELLPDAGDTDPSAISAAGWPRRSTGSPRPGTV